MAHGEVPQFFAISNAYSGAADQASEYPEGSTKLRKLCDGKRKLWAVDTQKEFTCTKGSSDLVHLKPGFLIPNETETAYWGDVQLVSTVATKPGVPVVREANHEETKTARKLAAELFKTRKKANKGKEQIYAFANQNVQVTDLAEGRKAMIFPAVLTLFDRDAENFAWHAVAVFEKGAWALSSKQVKVYNTPLDDRDGVTFIPDGDGKGWPMIRNRMTFANSMEVEYQRIFPVAQTVAIFKSEGPTD